MKNPKESRATVLFIGGHHNSALTVAKELIRREQCFVVWVGHKHTMDRDKSVSAEFEEVTSVGIKFYELKTGKIYKSINPLQLLKVILGFLQAYWLLLRIQPKIICSFGGYLAAPVVLAGWLQGITVVTHEQTTVVGLANRFISWFAEKIFVTWPQSKIYFPTNKVVVTGLPLRPEIFIHKNKREIFQNDQKTIYITGGKQGSHIINLFVKENLESLLKRFNIIHQCGSNSIYDDFNMLKRESESLSPNLSVNYRLGKYFFADEIGQIFYESDVVISRAGGHTVYEIAALEKPAIFIPIPWVSHNEQYKNARLLMNEGAAVIIPQDRLEYDLFITEVERIINNLNDYLNAASRTKKLIVFDATDRFINEIKAYI